MVASLTCGHTRDLTEHTHTHGFGPEQQQNNKHSVIFVNAPRRRVCNIPGTNSAAGLQKTTNLIEDQGRHEDGVPVVVIFLTDGRSRSASQTREAAENLHATLPQVKLSPNTVIPAKYYVYLATSHRSEAL